MNWNEFRGIKEFRASYVARIGIKGVDSVDGVRKKRETEGAIETL